MHLRFYTAKKYPPFQISADTTVREIMAEIERWGLRCISLVGESGIFLGLVTDGDVRRRILAGLEINSPGLVLVEKQSLTVSETVGLEEVERIMDSRSVEVLPVVDGSRKYRGTYVFDSPELGRDNCSATGFIMAGGKGSRLRPLTLDTPKPLIKVGRESLLENALRGMAKIGIRKVFVSVNYMAEKIMSELENGGPFDLSIEFLKEDFETGTAGSLSKLCGKDVEESIVVSNADVLHRTDLRDLLVFHQTNKADITILTMPHQVSVPFGVIEIENSQFRRVVEKPTYTFSVSAGVYVISRRLIREIPDNRKYDMPELIDDAKANSYKVLAYEAAGPWIDVGTVGNLERARETWVDV